MNRFSCVVFCMILTSIVADNPCQYSGPKGVINLTSLGRVDGTARFSDVSPGVASNYKFSYNPCQSFTEASCVNVSACQVSNDLAYRFTIGLQETAVWNPGSGPGANPTIIYTFDTKTTKVSLVCGGDDPKLEALGENPTNFYTFRLTHKCACWNGCTDSSSTSTVSTTVTTVSPVQPTSCKYTGPKGTIDLTSLGRVDHIPQFLDVSPGSISAYKYSYNPCQPFSEGVSCDNVAVCQVTNDLYYRLAIGFQNTFQWSNDGGIGNNPSISYRNNSITSEVTLICGGENPVFVPIGEKSMNHYMFLLIHKCACWNQC